jgi:putative transposase
LKNIILGICQNYCFEFDAIYNDGDHIHLFVGAEPKYSPSKIMQKIKNIGARQIFKEHPILESSFVVVNHREMEDTLEYLTM